jgi:hypothetical protein
LPFGKLFIATLNDRPEEAGVAMNNNLDLYLRLERIIIELDGQNDPFADQIRDLMDPLWYTLSDEDHQFLDNREEMEIRILYPVTLTVPDLFALPSAEQPSAIEISPEDGVGRRYRLEGVIPLQTA